MKKNIRTLMSLTLLMAFFFVFTAQAQVVARANTAPISQRPPDAEAADAGADIKLDFALSPSAAGYKPTTRDGLVYFEVSTDKNAGCNLCKDVNAPECEKCWWARCERHIQDPATLNAIQTFVGRTSPRFDHVKNSAELLKTWDSQESVFQSLFPQNKEEWDTIEKKEDRRAIENLAHECSALPPQLVFSLEFENTSDETVRARAVKYHILVDGGEAGGGLSGSGPFFPSATYVHVIERDCNAQPEVYECPLVTGNSRVFRITPGSDNAFELLLNVKTYDGAFMAPHRLRIEIVTDQGTVSTDEFWVDLFSCAG